VEVTPLIVRLRKAQLSAHERSKARGRERDAAG